jgi:hypothetical protein
MIETSAFLARRSTFRVAVVLAILASLLFPRVAEAQAISWVPYDLPQLQQTTLKSAAGAPYRIIVAKPTGPAPAFRRFSDDRRAWAFIVGSIPSSLPKPSAELRQRNAIPAPSSHSR